MRRTLLLHGKGMSALNSPIAFQFVDSYKSLFQVELPCLVECHNIGHRGRPMIAKRRSPALACDFLQEWNHSVVQLLRNRGILYFGKLTKERGWKIDVNLCVFTVFL